MLTVRCMLAVVLVLSKEFFTGEWPTEEVELLLRWWRAGPTARLLPVCYNMTPQDMGACIAADQRAAGGMRVQQWEGGIEALSRITGFCKDKVGHCIGIALCCACTAPLLSRPGVLWGGLRLTATPGCCTRQVGGWVDAASSSVLLRSGAKRARGLSYGPGWWAGGRVQCLVVV
jgi:hypothetical protein